MVEGARLESVYMGNCIKSSNLLLSASPRTHSGLYWKLYHPDYLGRYPLVSTKNKAMGNSGLSFYVYILQSLKDFSFYVGQCNDLDRRICKHFDGMSKYTSGKRLLRLVHFEVFIS